MSIDEQVLIDSLSYIDPPCSPQVNDLIRAEMQRPKVTRDDYELFTDRPALKLMLQELEGGNSSIGKPMDLLRLQCQDPSTKDIRDWKDAVSNAKSQLEHQSLRTMNLELQSRYGSTAWKMHLMDLQSLVGEYQKRLEAAKQEIDTVNRNRQSQQLSHAKPTLDSLNTRRKEILKTIEALRIQLDQK